MIGVPIVVCTIGVIQYEFVDWRVLQSLEERGVSMWPSPACVRVVQDKLLQKQALARAELPVPPFLEVADSDGVIGIKHIKEQGGLTIAQDPAEADFDSMPRSAIATGMVDWVLPVTRMPAQLLEFMRNEQKVHVWAEAWVGDHWLPMCPFHKHCGRVPASYLVFGFGDVTMVRGQNVRNLDYACLVASLTVARAGADPPWKSELIPA